MNEIETYYFFNDGTVVCLLHYSNNRGAAEQAMLKAYRRTNCDISYTGYRANGAYTIFDGRDYH